jgi:hypothetical protein
MLNTFDVSLITIFGLLICYMDKPIIKRVKEGIVIRETKLYKDRSVYL